MKLYVARHGQTQWNAENKVCGRTDLPLTETGIHQARALSEKAADLGIDLILTSPLDRAHTMARIIADRCGAEVKVEERLIEQDYGVFEGVDRQDPGFLANKRQFAVRYPGGESMMDMAGRLYPLLREIREKYPEKCVLLACHGGVCRVIRTFFVPMTNEEYFSYSPENCSLECYEL
jgi:probable phosphoglycerate mutase